MHYFKYILFGFLLSACSNSNLSVEQDNNKYYCVYFDEGGTKLHLNNLITSTKDLRTSKGELKKLLSTINKNADAYYYEVVKNKNDITIYAYSILNNKLHEIIKTNKNGVLEQIEYKIPETNICTIEQHYLEMKKLKMVKNCSNGENEIKYLIYDKKLNFYIPQKDLYYKNNILYKKIMYQKDGMTYMYDNKGQLISKGSYMNEGDLCTPYILRYL